jgi:hypothetical protein
MTLRLLPTPDPADFVCTVHLDGDHSCVFIEHKSEIDAPNRKGRGGSEAAALRAARRCEARGMQVFIEDWSGQGRTIH